MVAAATTLATAATPSRRAVGAVAAILAAERARWPLWLPVAMAGGIAAYFALPAEPPPWPAPAVAAAALAGCFAAGGRTGLLVFLIALLAAAAGFGAAQLRAHLVAAPVLEREIGPVTVSGRIAAIELRDVGVRLAIARPTVGRLPAAATPGRVRVAVRSGADGLAVGDKVRFTGVLLPPPEPPLPGGFDFARTAYFAGFGAVGFAYGAPELVAARDRPSLAEAVAGARTAIARRILAALPGETGALAAALMTGERGAISEDVLVAMRRSGLAHLLAISGLHLGLLAGVVFFAVRGGLALVEPVALRHPVKKWAAVLALLAAFAYMVLTGATVPTQRAFLMTGLVLLAVLVDRTAISMRLVAVAAAAVLAVAPESLLSVSFQMSFAAVVALVATYESAAPAMAAWFRDAGPLVRVWRYPAGVALTTLVASAATAPFAAYHFNQVVAYSLPANLVAVPVTALWIMPLAVAAFALMPFGLEAPALAAMGWGIDAVIAVAHATAALPGAMHMLADPPAAALAATVLGGLWLCLWRTRWRLAGLRVAVPEPGKETAALASARAVATVVLVSAATADHIDAATLAAAASALAPLVLVPPDPQGEVERRLAACATRWELPMRVATSAARMASGAVEMRGPPLSCR